VRSLSGHADLIRVVAALRERGAEPGGELGVALELLGLGLVEAPRAEAKGPARPAGQVAETTVEADTRAWAEVAAVPSGVPFWQPYRFEWRSDEALEAADVRARGDLAADVAAESGERRAMALIAPPETPRLTAPSRLLPLLLRAVTADLVGRDIDVPALVRQWSRGVLVRRIPRLRRRGWPALVLLLDRGIHLVPFWQDQLAVRDLLHGMLGRAGLVVRFVADRGPEGTVYDARGRPKGSLRDGSLAGMPILALSDLGWYGGPELRRGWLRTGRALRGAGERIFALAPVPSSRWTPELAALWSATAWERPGAAPDGEELAERADRLLDLAALARRLEPGLLRALRLLLPRDQADVGTEADAWMHEDLEAMAAGWTYLKPEAAALRRARLAASGDRDLLARAHEVLRRWHWHAARRPELWHMEALGLAAVEPGLLTPAEVDVAEAGIERLARRAVALGEGGGAEAQLGALRRWLDHVAGHAPGLLDGETRGGGALQQAWGATHAADELPPNPIPGLLGLGRGRWPGRPKSAALRQSGRAVEVIWPEALVRGQRTSTGGPLGSLWAGELQVVPLGRGVRPAPLAFTSPVRIETDALEEFELRTDRSTVGLRRLLKPAWARAIGRDRFGLWAELFVKGVAYRMRWIPPGRFVMGPPADEPGRYGDEGPQHPVTITRGYWLGETPVTQALWEAVTGENPSRFKTPDRPVERVSWEECQESLIAALNEAIPAEGGESFRLPTDAEWEYACRAGTTTATYAGPIETLGANNAPVLDAIAWYGGNSGVEYDLEVFASSSGWPDKQHEHSRAGSRRVGQKLPNQWGLHDMLGNVWEWCMDHAPGASMPAKYTSAAQQDPAGPATGGGRVSRGGAWDSDARDVRAAYRSANHPGGRGRDRGDLGLRLARAQGVRQDPAGPEGP